MPRPLSNWLSAKRIWGDSELWTLADCCIDHVNVVVETCRNFVLQSTLCISHLYQFSSLKRKFFRVQWPCCCWWSQHLCWITMLAKSPVSFSGYPMSQSQKPPAPGPAKPCQATPQVQSASTGAASVATVEGWRNRASMSRPCSCGGWCSWRILDEKWQRDTYCLVVRVCNLGGIHTWSWN